ncbi:DNA type IV secretion system protein ComB10 [Campylobacter upsaliensis]|nr:TrbI/VirB10 family protein [Campylobacter upsaliensis]EIB3311911.1 DNA type IV secretion system protein ComB10 [Campylobacter upsaliensis]
MKKTYLISFALALHAFNPLLAQQESLFKEEQNKSTNYLKKDNLEHLYKDTKFPVNDYIYQAGFKEPDDETSIENITKMMKDEVKAQDLKTNPKPQILENNATKVKEIEDKIKKLKEQSPPPQKIAPYDPHAQTKKLLRDSILASRNSEIKDFSNHNRFGADGFSNQKSIDIATNEHKLFRMIRAGKLIPATLTSAISSELSGIVTAQVEQDIYATMGKAVLIPRGSKVIGFYSNDNKIGQNRLEIKWREIITPQGINVLLTDAIVSDNMGMAGAVGSVNNKYFERYGIAFGLSTISNALLLTIASKVDKGGNQYVEDLYSQGKSDVGTIVDDIIQQQSQIKPTIEIKAGSRIYIVPTNHIWFSKPKNGEVLMKYFIE